MATRAEQQRANELYAEATRKISPLGDSQEAIPLLDEAITIDPANASVWRTRGFVKSLINQYEEAIKDFDEAIRLAPKNDAGWHNRGDAKINLGRYEEAIKDFDEAIRLAPKNDAGWRNRGDAKINLGRYEEAIEDLDEAIRLKPDNHAAWNSRGRANSGLQRYAEGIKDFDEAIRLSPDYAKSWTNRGIARFRIKEHREVIKDLDEAIRINPDDDKALAFRGRAHQALDHSDQAKADFERALQLNAENSSAVRGLLAVERGEKSKGTQKPRKYNSLQKARKFIRFLTGYGRKLHWAKSVITARIVFLLNPLIIITWVIMVVFIGFYSLYAIFPELGGIVFDELAKMDTFLRTFLIELETVVGSKVEKTVPQPQNGSDFFLDKASRTLPLLILIFPFIWAIRLLNTAKDKAEIIREDYYRRALVQKTMQEAFDLLSQDDSSELEKQKRDAWRELVRDWLNHSPAEMLLQIRTRGKSGGDGNQSPHEKIISEIRRIIEATSEKGDKK